jgi:peptide/nickel transport system permease protein
LIRYFSRRLMHAGLLLFGATVLTFLFTSLAPGNYFDEMRLNPQISAQALNSLEAHYDLDKPVAVRYLAWLKSLARGEMGYSFAYNAPVSSLLFPRARNTLLLTSISTLIAWCIALPLGVFSAANKERFGGRAVTVATTVLLIVPDIALALGLLMFGVHTHWFPTGGLSSIGADSLQLWPRMLDIAGHLFLPSAILILSAQPLLVRHIRSAIYEVLSQPFIFAAKAHGISRRRLLWRYALSAALNPLISLFGFSVGALLSGSLLVEVVTSWPGLGPFLLEAILARDIYVVIGGVLLSTVFLVAGNFLADALLFWADPRIRLE